MRLGYSKHPNHVILGTATNLEEYNKVKYTDLLFTCAAVLRPSPERLKCDCDEIGRFEGSIQPVLFLAYQL